MLRLSDLPAPTVTSVPVALGVRLPPAALITLRSEPVGSVIGALTVSDPPVALPRLMVPAVI